VVEPQIWGYERAYARSYPQIWTLPREIPMTRIIFAIKAEWRVYNTITRLEVFMILVTGASGYVGSHIIRKLLDAGRPVRGLVFNRDRAEQEGRLKGLDIDWVQGDVTRRESLMPVLQDVSAVVHTVAIAIEKSGGWKINQKSVYSWDKCEKNDWSDWEKLKF